MRPPTDGGGASFGREIEDGGGSGGVRWTEIDHSVQELFFVGDVLVERHWHNPQLFGEPPHAQRLDPRFVGNGDGGIEHPRPAQGNPPSSLDLLSQISMTS